MAMFRTTLSGDFDRWVQKIEHGVLNASVSASLEDSWDREENGARVAVRVFERFSHAGGNRVSMNVTLFQSGGLIHLCGITSGGSQAVFFKFNTLGEETFLDTLKDVVR